MSKKLPEPPVPVLPEPGWIHGYTYALHNGDITCGGFMVTIWTYPRKESDDSH